MRGEKKNPEEISRYYAKKSDGTVWELPEGTGNISGAYLLDFTDKPYHFVFLRQLAGDLAPEILNVLDLLTSDGKLNPIAASGRSQD
jgi:hypothetical protein